MTTTLFCSTSSTVPYEAYFCSNAPPTNYDGSSVVIMTKAPCLCAFQIPQDFRGRFHKFIQTVRDSAGQAATRISAVLKYDGYVRFLFACPVLLPGIYLLIQARDKVQIWKKCSLMDLQNWQRRLSEISGLVSYFSF